MSVEGYYLLEDAEGYLFKEADGGYYFFHCFKGEGFYYHSEESEYFHAGESLYDKEYGLETLDADLQTLALDGDYGCELGQALCGGGMAGDSLGGDHGREVKWKLATEGANTLHQKKQHATEGAKTLDLHEAEVAGQLADLEIHLTHTKLEDHKHC